MDFLRKYGWKNLLLWTAVGTLDFAGDYFNDVLWDRPFYWKEEIPFVTSWYTWFLLTPIVTRLANTRKYVSTPLARFIGFHIVGYILVSSIQIVLATIQIRFVASTLMELQPFEGIFYKTAVSGSFYNFVVYGIILLVVNSLHHYQELRLEQGRSVELKRQAAENKLQFLYNQLQPHFLFNVHHSIITLLRGGNYAKGLLMMEKLSELMRSTLSERSQLEQSLSRELHSLQLYLDIQKVRFEDRLDTKIDVTPDTLEALVPAMILQPLVENSVRYTLENSAGAGLIRITASATQGTLYLCISDNGVPEKELKGFGVGLHNTHQRLAALYGDKYSLEITQKTDQSPGAEVSIKIPLRYG